MLDYRVLGGEPLFVRPPVNAERLLRRLAPLERMRPWAGGASGLYVIRARKQTVPMTLIRRPWLRARAAVPVRARGLASAPDAAGGRVVELALARRARHVRWSDTERPG